MGALPDWLLALWRSIVRSNDYLTPFHTPDWLRSWCEAYSEVDDSFLYVVDSGAHNGIMCLMNHLSETRSASFNATDYTGLIAGPVPQVADEVAASLRAEASNRPVRLWNIRPDDLLLKALKSQCRTKVENRTAVLRCDLSTSDYHAPIGSGAISRGQLDRKRKRIERRGFEVSISTGHGLPRLPEMVEVNRRRWAQIGGPGSYSDHRRIDFVSRIAESRELQFLTAHLTDSSNNLVAYRFGPIDSSTYYDWNTAFDPAFEALSPGIYLLDEVVKSLKVTSALTTIDFLRGSESYKRGWATSESEVLEVVLQS